MRSRVFALHQHRCHARARHLFHAGGDVADGEADAAVARVVRVGDMAWPLTRLADEEEIREANIVLTWREGQASALDHRLFSISKDVGSVRVKDAEGNDLPHDVMFAFAFHAFWPDGEWMLGE